jgi:hypothetical protein
MHEQCKQHKRHFDWDSFLLGILIMLFAVLTFFYILEVNTEVNTTVHRVSTLPANCKAGQQVLITTAPTAELWVCESKWTRR